MVQGIIVLSRALVFIEKDDVLVQRDLTSADEFYRVPGGTVEFREKMDDCLVREIREETGLDLKVVRLIWVRDFIEQMSEHTIEFFFLTEIVGGKFNSALEIDYGYEFLFMSLEELEQVVFYPKGLIPKLKCLRDNRNITVKNPYLRSIN